MSRRKRKILKQRTWNAFKRLSAGLVAFTVVLSQVPVFGAFEAHVINVTATISPRCEDITVGGVKFDDRNGNGARDAGEAGLPGWMIELKRGPYNPQFDYNGNGQNDSNDYGVLEQVITDPPGPDCPAGTQCDFNGDGSLALASGDLTDFQNWLASRDFGNQVTDNSGHYEFGGMGLTYGEYIVTEVPKTGWAPTTETRREITIGACETTVDFGNRQELPSQTCVMELVKTDRSDPVRPGDELQYHLRLSNVGTGMCTGGGVRIEEHYDPRTAFVSATPTPTSSNNLWNFGQVQPGRINEVDVTVRVREDVLPGDVLTNEACFWTREYNRWTCVTETTRVSSGVCGNGIPERGEACDDGNLVSGDGCESDCKPTTFCGDGVVQTPDSYGVSEQCDDGVRNGTTESTCTKLCTPQQNQCAALSPGYYKNNDGCQNGTGSSIWVAPVNTLSDGLSDVFSTIDGAGMCVQFAVNCTTSTSNDVDKARCNAKKFLLADETNTVASRLRLDALVAGGYDGNAAFSSLGISATSTIQQAMTIIEQVIADSSSTKDQLTRARYVAGRLYTFYELENPDPFECVLPGMGNGVVEPTEQCDDGNLIPWDGCSPTGHSEVVLNEIMANPVGADNAPMPGGEWVELFNLAAKPIALDGWALYDNSNSHVLPITATSTTVATTTIAAGGRLVVYRNGNTKFELTNSGDRVRLYNAQIPVGGDLLDSFQWTTAKAEGLSYARVPDGIGDWVDPCPTPGEPNTGELCPSETSQSAAEVAPQTLEVEPPDLVPPAPDAATLSDELWALLFPERAYAAQETGNDAAFVSPTATDLSIGDTGKTEEMGKELLPEVVPTPSGDGDDPVTGAVLPTATTTPTTTEAAPLV